YKTEHVPLNLCYIRNSFTQNIKDKSLRQSAIYQTLGSDLIYLFSLEHGWSAFDAAGKHIENARENHTGLPIYSLYGPAFKKNLAIFETLDVVIIDIQDVGVRCYTHAAVCAKVFDYASSHVPSLNFIICDRPNPLGSKVNKPFFKSELKSLVSYIDVPFQHGKTVGELLNDHNHSLNQPVSLEIIPHQEDFDFTQHLWVPISPGLPALNSVLLYPGLVLLEGTNVSEGRGSTLPFQCVAAPELDSQKIINVLNNIPNSGIMACPFSFTPETGELAHQPCRGAQIHVVNPEQVNGLWLGLHLLQALIQHYPRFEWTLYKEKYWIDQLTGSTHLRESFNKGVSCEKILSDLDY
ncbi:MAG: exo-beta-N-acetylmuramidase NamZ domain-containing protein, partial [Janthinobacterium lividum]